MQFLHIYDVDISRPVQPVPMQQMLVQGDSLANRIGVRVRNGRTPAALAGTCSGAALRADGGMVALTGGITEDGILYVDLPQAAYAVEGQITVSITLTDDGKTCTPFVGFGTVIRTSSGTVIDPGTIIPSVAALIEDIDEAVASIPADYSALLASIAPAYSDLTFPVSAGTFCWHSGALYTANQDIPASESWTAAHWDYATIGGAIGQLSTGLSGRIDTLHDLVDYGYTTESSKSSTSGGNDMTFTRAGTKLSMNGALGASTSAFMICVNGELYIAASQSSYKNVSNGIKLTDGHKYRWSMKLVSGTFSANAWAARVYKEGVEQPITALNSVFTMPDGTSYYDFLYTDADYPDGVKMSMYINRNTTGASATNAVFECFLEDITHNAQIITDRNINYALRDSATLSSDFVGSKFFDLSGNIGSVVNVLGISADFCRQKVACHAGDTFVLTAKTDSTMTGANVWAFTDSDNKLLKKAAEGANASGLTLIADQDGYLLVNALVNETHTLTGSLLYKAAKATDIPTVPDSDGTYVLTVTVSGGVPTYSWTAQS